MTRPGPAIASPASAPSLPERRVKHMMDDADNWRLAEIDRTGNTETFIRWLPELDFTLTKKEYANAQDHARC